MISLVLPDISYEDHLLARARQGEQDAVIQIYESYFLPIYNFIRLRVGESYLAEDLTSEVFIRLIDALQKEKKAPKVSLRGWLFRVARNLIYDHYDRTHQFPIETLDEWIADQPDLDPEAQVLRTISAETVREAIRSLPIDQQEVLILRFGQMLDLQETADIMGKSVSAVKSLQFRAVNSLRSQLKAAGSVLWNH